jgi:hypothetical protein
VVGKKVQDMSDKQLNGQTIFQLQNFNLNAGGMFVDPGEASRTPVFVISGAPQVFDLDKVDSQNELIEAIRTIAAEKLLPEAHPVVAAVLRFPKRLPEQGGVAMVALVEKAHHEKEFQ